MARCGAIFVFGVALCVIGSVLCDEDPPKKIRFHFGANYEPYDFLENLPGEPEHQTGFGVEFAELLCKRNKLDCVFIRDNYEECWQSGDYPGRGLQSGWYDACSTYTNTLLRQRSVQFSHSYTMERPAGILSRLDSKGNPLIHPKDTDLGGKKIGIVGGWATNSASLKYIPNECMGGELYSNYKLETPKDEFSGPDAAMKALIDEDVDAVFLYSSLIEDRKGCTSDACDATLYNGLGTQYAWIHTGITEYQANGTTLAFTPKGSDLNEFLNPLIADTLATKEYAKLCEKYAGSDVQCFPNKFGKKEKVDVNNMNDLERMIYCEKKDDPDECLACKNGHCGCDVPRE